MNIGIYKIENNVNKKIYIGQSIKLNNRRRSHLYQLSTNIHPNYKLQKDYNSFGENQFTFEVLEYCSEEDLNSKEIYYIKKFNAIEDGYNIREGGFDSNISESTKEKIRWANSKLTAIEVKKIKVELSEGCSRKYIQNKYKISRHAVDNIVNGINFNNVLPELNEKIQSFYKDKKEQRYKRNQEIIDLLHQGLSHNEISKRMGVSRSIIEKVKYVYTDISECNIQKRKDIYDTVHLLHQQGLNNHQIATKLGIFSSVVDNYLTNKVNPYKKLNYKKLTKEQEIEIIDSDISNVELSKKYNVSINVIQSLKQKYKYANTEVTN